MQKPLRFTFEGVEKSLYTLLFIKEISSGIVSGAVDSRSALRRQYSDGPGLLT